MFYVGARNYVFFLVYCCCCSGAVGHSGVASGVGAGSCGGYAAHAEAGLLDIGATPT